MTVHPNLRQVTEERLIDYVRRNPSAQYYEFMRLLDQMGYARITKEQWNKAKTLALIT